ncbi:MAG TPA: hypothetical protein VK737_12520 [Opitutales bacterium]|jgi:hypothetical protein|nr:hypothetical protein [Opitutales bacterium]
MSTATLNSTPSLAAKTPAKTSPATAPQVIKPAPAAPKTESPVRPKEKNHIVAKVDVGWGNTVYLRGVGGGLSWDVGVPMTCLVDDEWVWSYCEENPPREIKFLRNDTDWAVGDNQVVLFEKVQWCVPRFP